MAILREHWLWCLPFQTQIHSSRRLIPTIIDEHSLNMHTINHQGKHYAPFLLCPKEMKGVASQHQHCSCQRGGEEQLSLFIIHLFPPSEAIPLLHPRQGGGVDLRQLLEVGTLRYFNLASPVDAFHSSKSVWKFSWSYSLCLKRLLAVYFIRLDILSWYYSWMLEILSDLLVFGSASYHRDVNGCTMQGFWEGSNTIREAWMGCENVNTTKCDYVKV